ncbi:MAG: type 1 glutamine amidotransferase domain-containing protein [Bacteroidota bacterium]
MSQENLSKKKVLILATNGFEEEELVEPKKRLEEKNVKVEIASDKEKITGWDHGKWSKTYDVDKNLDEVNIDDYDLLLLPGGVINPDKLRRIKKAVGIVQGFFEKNKPVAAICHGPQMLIEAGVVNGRKMTSFFSISTDLKNAGAEWIDEQVVVDKNLITSRNPGDLEVFSDKIIDVLSR